MMNLVFFIKIPEYQKNEKRMSHIMLSGKITKNVFMLLIHKIWVTKEKRLKGKFLVNFQTLSVINI